MSRVFLMTAVFMAAVGGIGYVLYDAVEGSATKTATIRLNSDARDETGPGATNLRLVAGGASSCQGEDELKNLEVEQNGSEIVIEADVRVDDHFMCESREAHVPFVVTLDKPLGRRPIIDGADGRRVIWSPERYANFIEATTASPAEAVGYIRSEFPRATTINCFRSKQVRFICEFERTGASRKSVVIELSRDGAGTWRVKSAPTKALQD